MAFICRFFQLVSAFFCGSSAIAQTDSSGHSLEVPAMNVLFIGNSFTHMNSMPVMFEKIAISKGMKINVVMSAKSNHTFEMHSKRADLYEDIKKAKWDYVILQGFSRELSYGETHIDTAVIPYFQQIVDTLKLNNPCVKMLLYMTWGYENGYAYMNEIGSFEEMSKSIESGYRYLGDKYDFAIVPVGNVWSEVRKDYPTYGLYQKDEHHPTKVGSYVVASTFFAAIFRSSPEGGYTAGLENAVALNIQRLAYDFVSKNLKQNKLDRDILDVHYKFTKTGKYEAKCMANFPKSTVIEWDMGDGTIIKDEKEFTHYYSKFGNYKVKLTVEDACGQRVIYRNVYFKEPYQPRAPTVSTPVKNDSSIKKRI